MSFDLGVWNTTSANAERSAAWTYECLCKGEHPEGVAPSPAVAAFYEDLIQMWPPLAAAPNRKAKGPDISPWSAPIHHAPDHILISSDWSRAEEVFLYIQNLALKHKLVFFDPQSDEVYLPE